MISFLTALAADTELEFVAACGGDAQVRIERRCADVAELLSVAAAGLGDCAVVSPGLPHFDREAVVQLRGCGLAVVALVEPADSAAARALQSIGVDAILPPGSSLAEVLAAVTAASIQPSQSRALTLDVEPAAASPRGKVVAVWGATGAPGRTTVAVALAWELARAHSTILVDADTYGASIAQVLGMLDEAAGLVAVTRAADQGTLDVEVLKRRAVPLGPQLRVLTGLPRADRWPEIRPAALDAVLEAAREIAAFVVVDCGFGIEADEELSYDTAAPQRNATTRTVLSQADEIIVVASADPVGLGRAVRGLHELRELTPTEPVVVANRIRASAVGSDPDAAVTRLLERFAGVHQVTGIPEVRDDLDRAILSGRALAEVAPRSAALAPIRELAKRVGGSTPARTDRRDRRTRRPRRRLWGSVTMEQ